MFVYFCEKRLKKGTNILKIMCVWPLWPYIAKGEKN